jgi:hypothetical protein
MCGMGSNIPEALGARWPHEAADRGGCAVVDHKRTDLKRSTQPNHQVVYNISIRLHCMSTVSHFIRTSEPNTFKTTPTNKKFDFSRPPLGQWFPPHSFLAGREEFR